MEEVKTMKRSLYDVLGITDESDTGEIESAYQDKAAGLEEAGDHESQSQLKLLQQARDILSDPDQRAKYDKQLKLDKLKQTSAIQYEEKKKEGSLMPLLLIALVLSSVVYFGYRHYVSQQAAFAAQQHADSPAGDAGK